MIIRTATVPRVLPGGQMNGVAPTETQRYAGGRTCVREGCETRLSAYNPGAWCGIHEAPRRFVARAERRTPVAGPEPKLVGIAELMLLVRPGGADHHPEPGPEPAPAPAPPPPIPSATRTR